MHNENTVIYTLSKRKNNLTFVAPENGIYTFVSNGQIKNRFNADKGNIVDSADGINQNLS